MFFISGCANAGKDQSVKAGSIVTLDASKSTSLLKGPILKYKWKQIEGIPVDLENKDSAEATFIAPNVEEKSILIFKLSTFEKKYGKSFSTHDEVIINILPNTVVENKAPIANINASSTIIKEKGSITFNSNTSTDEDGTIVSYTWNDGDTILSTEETYTHTFNNAGTSTISLTVMDNDNASNTASIDIIVNALEAPIAKIIASKVNVTLNEEIRFDANTSTDSDGNIVSYKWLDKNAQTLGSNDTLLHKYLTIGEYKVNLIVTDDDGLTSTDSVVIEVTPSLINTNISIQGTTETTANVKVGEKLQLKATAYFNDNSSQDYTNKITWNYLTQFASIDANGLLTGLKKGYTSVSATNTNSLDINITEADGTVSVSGLIKDSDNKPIIGASVTVEGVIKVTGTNGTYSFTNLEKKERINVNVTHPEYMANSRVVISTTEHQSFIQDIVLTKAKASITFNSAVATTLEQSTYAKVELPANGYVDSEGNPYIGEVVAKMSYFPISTRTGQASFPGTFEGIKDNETFPIESFGFMNVELTDLVGQELNLAPGSTARLTYPLDYNAYTSRQTIPLWYYDTHLGYWVEEGSAQKVGYSSFTGTVTHFTSWNLDAKGLRSGNVNVCVEDKNSIKVSNAYVQFTSSNWTSYSLQTDTNGSLEVYNALAGKALTITASKLLNGKIHYGEYPDKVTLVEGADKNISSCIVLEDQGVISASNTIRIKGRAVNFDNVPVANVSLSLNNDLIPTDGNGYFDSVITTPDRLSNSIGDGECNTYFTLQANKAVYDLGDISVCMF
jgi:hypothetical protein